ncbi:MAG: amidase family protein, partial [Actinomycetota bacterium]
MTDPTPADPPLTLTDAAAGLRDGAWTSVELTRRCLAITEALDETVGAFVTSTAESAMADAARADDELASGVDHGPLHGIPFALKDILATTDSPTTANSRV